MIKRLNKKGNIEFAWLFITLAMAGLGYVGKTNGWAEHRTRTPGYSHEEPKKIGEALIKI